MEFSGTLKEESFAEVLVKVAEKNATGLLTFKTRRKKVEIDWIKGQIIHVVEHPAPISGNLGHMLVEIGEINANQLSQAIIQQRRSLSPLGQILIKLFNVSQETIRLALRVQAIETLYEMFSWTDGEFTFKYGLVDRKGNTFDPINIHQFLSEAIPALEVWPEVRKQLPSPDVEVQSVGSSLPDDGTFDHRDHQVFAAIQERERTYRELSIVTGLGRFVVGQVLLKLLNERLIYLRPPKKEGIRWGQLLLGGSLLDFTVWVLATALLVGTGTYLLAFAPYSPLRVWQPRHRYRITDARWPLQVDRWRLQRIRRALTLYHIEFGDYPVRLKALQKAGWISAATLRGSDGQVFSYHRRSASQYRLERALR